MALRFRPKLDKVVELLLYLAHVRPGADKYQAVKFFYLADREHLARYGRPITFDSYYALSYGPVASKTLDIIHKQVGVLRAAGIEELPFETKEGKAYNGTDTIFIGRPYREVNPDLFSESDLAVFNEIIGRYGHLSFGQLFDITHEHNAYKKAWGSRGFFNRAEMDYADMIGDLVDDEQKRDAMIDDLLPIAAHMQ